MIKKNKQLLMNSASYLAYAVMHLTASKKEL